LIQLKYDVPAEWHQGSVYLMNQKTFALLLTMSDTSTRPLWTSLPGTEPGFTLAGSPIVIASQIPDVAPGSAPVLFGGEVRLVVAVPSGGEDGDLLMSDGNGGLRWRRP
jgi:HK97 family phage major capsid protein